MNDNGDHQKRGSIAEDGRDWLARVLAHDATTEDEAAMREWGNQSSPHARALDHAAQMHGRVLNVRDALRSDPGTVELLASARAGLKPQQQPGARIGRRTFLAGAIAASAAGVMLVRPPLGLWPSLGELRADYRTGTGERRTVQIASGLAVELNTRTALARGEDMRAYRLNLIAGEVAVDARQLMRPAVVETHFGEASTSNGHFSARLQDDGMCVTCFAGEIAVSAREQPPVRLFRGQRTIVGAGPKATVTAVDPKIAEAWRRGELIFNDRPLSEVVAEINRYRSGRIVLTNSELAARSVNAIFRIDRLESAPSQIRIVSRATITTLPGGLVLLS